MRAFEFLLEKKQAPVEKAAAPTDPNAVPGDPATDPLYNLKLAIAHKIKEMPIDPATEKALHEVEDLLGRIMAGGRTESVSGELTAINDPDVNAAQKLLAKYILSMEASPANRSAMMKQWATEEGLVDIKALLTPGKNTVSSIIKGYTTNPAIKELADDLAGVASLGQGKGEFMLSVFSKMITKAKKGDLQIEGFGTLEVKTTDVGAARFYDQQVRPTKSFQGAVNDFLETYKETIAASKLMSPTGMNLDQLISLRKSLPPEANPEFKTKLSAVISNIFAITPDLAQPVVDAIMVDNLNQAKQRYAVACLNNYMSAKVHDNGMLVINLTKNPFTFVFFTDNQTLNAGGMRLHASTAYPVTNDPRNAYPQTDIVDTSRAQE
jgi:hypothetical protein